jgi:hypothetical protein
MCEVILYPIQKKKIEQGSKNLCSTRDMVAKLFIAIHVNFWFRRGVEGGREVAWDGMVAFYFIYHAVSAGGHFSFS